MNAEPMPDPVRSWRNSLATWCNRVMRSITFKFLMLIIPILALTLAPLAYQYWQDSRNSQIKSLAAQLEVIARGQRKRESLFFPLALPDLRVR